MVVKGSPRQRIGRFRIGRVESSRHLIKTNPSMFGIFRRPERGYERGHENRLLAWIPPSEVAPRVPVPLTLSDKGVAAGILCISDVVRCWKWRLLVRQIRLLLSTRYYLLWIIRSSREFKLVEEIFPRRNVKLIGEQFFFGWLIKFCNWQQQSSSSRNRLWCDVYIYFFG